MDATRSLLGALLLFLKKSCFYFLEPFPQFLVLRLKLFVLLLERLNGVFHIVINRCYIDDGWSIFLLRCRSLPLGATKCERPLFLFSLKPNEGGYFSPSIWVKCGSDLSPTPFDSLREFRSIAVVEKGLQGFVKLLWRTDFI